MKNKIIYLFVLLVGVLACSDDFTETPAYGALSDASLQNAAGVDLLLIGAYSLLDGNSNTGGSDYARAADGWWTDVMSDDAHKGSIDSDQPALYDAELMNWGTTNGYFDARWVGLFAGVNRANSVIDLIAKLVESGDTGDYTQQLAQARFLRAHYNFELQIMWGNIPFISVENFAAVEFNQPNPGPIWDKILEDMDFATKNLPDSQSEVGRPTNWVATAYMGKIHLFKGDFTQAYGYFNTVIGSGPYSLLDEFVDNFRLAGDNSEESLLAIQFLADDGLSFNGNIGGTLNFPGPINCCGFYNPTQDLLNSFQTDANGLPLLDTYNQTDVKSDYDIASAPLNAPDTEFTPHEGNLDPRADYTVGRRGIMFNGYGVHVGQGWQRSAPTDIGGPYTPKKNVYTNGEDANQGAGGWGEQRSGVNYHIMRYADVLLMGAEAAVEVGELGDALDWVNLVRKRAMESTPVKAYVRVNNPDVESSESVPVMENGEHKDAANYVINEYPSFADADYARKAVRMERRLELGMEGKRLFDIRRWGDAVQRMNAYFTNEARTVKSFGEANPAAYENKHNLTPIPLRAIDLSGGILTQNSGY